MTSVTQAIQEVQVAENQKQVAIAEGETAIAQARADSAQRVIRAAGEAEEMKRKQVVLTKEYIEFLRVSKWNGQYPTTMAGNGTSLLIQPQ